MIGSVGAFVLLNAPLGSKPGLHVSLLVTTTPASFPIEFDVISLIENTNSRGVDALETFQKIPSGFKLTRVYLIDQDGQRSPCEFAVTPEGLKCSFPTSLRPGNKIGINTLLQSTIASVSGNFTTQARGTYDGKWIESRASTWINVPPPQSTCFDYDDIRFGDFMLGNNVWGGPTYISC
jgi:hypothetical protein